MAVQYKYLSIEDPAECDVNSVTEIDFQLGEDLNIYGGEIFVSNAEIGDYVSVVLVAPDGENVVATYIEKMFIDPVSKSIKLNNWPEYAEISSDFYVRTIYHAVNVGSNRTAVINYLCVKGV